MHFCSWNYWHSAMLLAKSMTIITAYDMYIECALGKLNPLWKIQKHMPFWRCWEYPGDEGLRKSTHQRNPQCRASKAKGVFLSASGGSKHYRGCPSKCSASPSVPLYVKAEAFVATSTGRNTRLCGNQPTLVRYSNAQIYDKHGVQ
jgi:hypothetical protein